MSELKFATRLNSFASGAWRYWPELKGKPSVLQMIERAATAKGLTHLDLNYPQHITDDVKTMRQKIEDVGLAVNGMQMRWDAPEFKIGAYTNPDAKIRRQAIELTKRGIDAGREFGASIMTLWMGQDGFDYCFQVDYKKVWEDAVSAVREVAEYAGDMDVSIEYKPNEPRAFAISRTSPPACWRWKKPAARIWVSPSTLPTCCMRMRSRPMPPPWWPAVHACSASI